MSTTATSNVYSLLDVVANNGHDPAYIAKMMHDVPEVEVIDRAKFIAERCKDQRVLDIGCTGPLAEIIRGVAGKYYGIDINPPAGPEYYQLDIDMCDSLPVPAVDGQPAIDIIIAGEVIEHLSNPGRFLDMLHAIGKPVILTTPNALSAAGIKYIQRGIEHVSIEHVSWFSWRTLTTLVERHRFEVKEWYWYNGKPLIAEGLVFVMET